MLVCNIQKFISVGICRLHTIRRKLLENECFELSYVEELNMIKEHETICRESQWDCLKIKQAIVTAPRNVSV